MRDLGGAKRGTVQKSRASVSEGYFPSDTAFLSHVANRIINEVRGFNRVTYDITSKPPGTVEWE